MPSWLTRASSSRANRSIRRRGSVALAAIGEDLDKEAAEFASQLHSLENEKHFEPAKPDGSASNPLIDAINHFLATRGLAALRKIQMDADRIQIIVSNAVYYIVAPAARTRSNTLEIDASVVAVISELVRTPVPSRHGASPSPTSLAMHASSACLSSKLSTGNPSSSHS